MKRLSVQEALQILEIQRDTPWEQIRSAYRDRVRSAHPDINEGHDGDTLVISLNAAYATLVAATKSGK
jgi:DnaJ-class molecular chaperone